MDILNQSETLTLFWLHSFAFDLEQCLKNAKFLGFFLPQKTTFGGYFVLKVCTQFQKYEAEQGMNVPNLSDTFKLFWKCSNGLKNANFSGFFALKKIFGSYFE